MSNINQLKERDIIWLIDRFERTKKGSTLIIDRTCFSFLLKSNQNKTNWQDVIMKCDRMLEEIIDSIDYIRKKYRIYSIGIAKHGDYN